MKKTKTTMTETDLYDVQLYSYAEEEVGYHDQLVEDVHVCSNVLSYR